MKDYTLSELRKIDEAYRSVYDNPNVRLDNDPTGLKHALAGKISAFQQSSDFPQISKYVDMLFRWLNTDMSEKNPDLNFLKRVYVDNFVNVVDYLSEYEYNVKKLKANKTDPAKWGLDVCSPSGKMFFLPYDSLLSTRSRFNGINLINRTSRLLQIVDKKRSSDTLNENDRNNIVYSNSGNGAVVFTTTTYESTNKFIYHLWQNSNFNTGYGEPDENSPYCTRVRNHWDTYSNGDPNYQQYWFFRDDGSSNGCGFGNLNDEDVMRFFNSLKGRGGSLLICMNDSFGDILDRYDERPDVSKNVNLGNYVNFDNVKYTEAIKKKTELSKDFEEIRSKSLETKFLLNKSLEKFTANCVNYVKQDELYSIISSIENMMLYGFSKKMANFRFPSENDKFGIINYFKAILYFIQIILYENKRLSMYRNEENLVWNAEEIAKFIANKIGLTSDVNDVIEIRNELERLTIIKTNLYDEIDKTDRTIDEFNSIIFKTVTSKLKDSTELLKIFEFPN